MEPIKSFLLLYLLTGLIVGIRKYTNKNIGKRIFSIKGVVMLVFIWPLLPIMRIFRNFRRKKYYEYFITFYLIPILFGSLLYIATIETVKKMNHAITIIAILLLFCVFMNSICSYINDEEEKILH